MSHGGAGIDRAGNPPTLSNAGLGRDNEPPNMLITDDASIADDIDRPTIRHRDIGRTRSQRKQGTE